MAIRRTLGLLLAATVAASGLGMSQASAATAPSSVHLTSAASAVSITSTARPRLIANPSQVSQAASTSDPVSAKLKSYVMWRADHLLGATPVSYTLNGGRLLDVSEAVLNRTYVLAAAWLITKDTKYTDQLWKDLAAAAAFPDWNPDHFLDTGEMANAFGVAYDWAYGAWTPTQLTTMQNALISKAFQPALKVYTLPASDPYPYKWDGNWALMKNNRNLVINSGLGMAALAISGDASSSIPQTILDDSVTSIQNGLSEYASDGGYAEGPSYWEWATKRLISFITSLKVATGSDSGLAQNAGLQRTSQFGLAVTGADGTLNSFSDSATTMDPTAVLSGLAQLYGDRGLDGYAAASTTTTEASLRLFWHQPGIAADSGAINPAKDLDFPSARFFSMRQSWTSPTATSVAFKYGGTNSPPDHQQADAGTFDLESLGQPWAVDLGKEDLSYDLTDAPTTNRLDYYRNRPEGHNTMVFDMSGSSFKLDAPVTKVRAASNDFSSYYVADLSKLYPDQVTSWRRGVKLTDNRQQVIVQDEFQTKTKSPVSWRMQTAAQISVSADGKTAYLVSNGRLMQATITKGPGAFTVSAAAPMGLSPNPQQTPNTGYSALTIDFVGDTTPQTLAVQFTPMPSGVAAAVPVTPQSALSSWTLDAGGASRLTAASVDGQQLPGFSSSTFQYTSNVTGSSVPVVSATAPTGASVVVTQASAVPGEATVTVTESGKTATTYSIDFMRTSPATPTVPNAAGPLTVTPTASTAQVGVDQTTSFAWKATAATGQSVSSPDAAYGSADTSVATVTDDGTIVGVGPGTTRVGVKVSDSGAAGYASVSVTVINPTQTKVYATTDTYVEGGSSADQNYGSASGMLVKGPGPRPPGDGAGVRISYLGFTLPALPAGSTVVSAGLNLQGSIVDNSFTGTKARVDAHQVTGTWAEGSTTYSQRPSMNTAVEGSTAFSKTASWSRIDITKLVARTATTSSSSPMSIALQEDSLANGLPVLLYLSTRESGARPYLDLVIQSAPTALTAATVSPAGTGKLANTLDSQPTTTWSAAAPATATWGLAQDGPISSVSVTWGTGSTSGIPVTVQTSVDGTNWDTRVAGSASTAGTTSTFKLSAGGKVHSIRLVANGSGTLSIATFSAYAYSTSAPPIVQYLNTVKWNTPSAQLSLGGTVTPTVTSTDSVGAPMTVAGFAITSSDPSVVSVSNGVLTAAKVGSTTVTVAQTDPATGNTVSAAYPITVVDPNQIRLYATADTYVEGGANSNTNYGTAGSLAIKPAWPSVKDGTATRYTYLAFSLPAIPGGSKVLSATLNAQGVIYDNSFTGSAVRIDAHELNSGFIETTTTWANQPTANTATQGSTAYTKTSANGQFDLTNLVAQRSTSTTTPLNIGLTEDNPPNATPVLVLISSRESTTRPYIDITYGATTATTSPAVKTQYLDKVTWTNAPTQLTVGTPVTPQYTAADSTNKPMTVTGYTATSADPTIAAITSTGQINGAKAGTTTITISATDPATKNTISRAYPITVVDPDQIRLYPTADAYVDGGSNASTNYGAATGRLVKGPGATVTGTGAGVRLSYFGFSLPAIPKDKKVVSATLNVYGVINDSSFTGASMQVDAHQVTGTWTESGVTYATKPSLTPTAAGSSTYTKTAGNSQFDLGSLVSSVAGSSTTPLAIALTEDTATASNNALVYLTARDTGRPPYLDLVLAPVTSPAKK